MSLCQSMFGLAEHALAKRRCALAGWRVGTLNTLQCHHHCYGASAAAQPATLHTYCSLVGGFLWLANMTLPTLAYAASQLARVLSNPGPTHYSLAMRVLAYLYGQRERTLTFAPDGNLPFQVLVDSNWATKFSVSGALYFYHGCLFYWFSKAQHSVSLSSAEAEFFGAMMAAREVLFDRDLFIELGIVVAGPTDILSDSQSAVGMAFDPISFKNTKHIMRAAEFLRDLVLKGHVILKHVPGTLMIADLLTKAPARATFIELVKLLDDYSRTP